MYAAIKGANNVLSHSFSIGKPVSPLKLQKLIYFIHGWFLACFDRPIFNESPEMWTYGPVFPEIYHDYKIFGSVPITKENWDEYGTSQKGKIPDNEHEFQNILRQVWTLYSPYSGLDLSELTHQADTPWSLAKKRGNSSLDEKEIKQHFKQLMNA